MGREGPARFRGYELQLFFGRGPRADETCTLDRVVERNGLRLEVWKCAKPTPQLLQRRSECRAFRFPRAHARSIWPGCASAWYDAIEDPFGCIPGLTQFVVYDGGASGTRRRMRGKS
jgi:hypothetical protein